MNPLISVVVATYRPSDGLDRVVASLDRQSLGTDRFEVIFVDDGSGDGTIDRLHQIAMTRPHVRVIAIENSGWPSRPRNVGIAASTGRWLLFMDHDDSLYPDALERLAAYAEATGADFVTPKESKTSDPWWGMTALWGGSRPQIRDVGNIDLLLPMVPHKLFRRSFLVDNDIRFPEGRRRLWEDIYLNVASWRHASRVAVWASSPVYLWHSSRGNNSKSYGADSIEYWDRLDELCAFIESTLTGAELEEARRAALLHQYRTRILSRLGQVLAQVSASEGHSVTVRAQRLQSRFIPARWDPMLGRVDRARAQLLRSAQAEALARLFKSDAAMSFRIRALSLTWDEGLLRVVLEGQLVDVDGSVSGFIRDGERVVRRVPNGVKSAVSSDTLDFSDLTDYARLDIAVRERREHVTWPVRAEHQCSWEDREDGSVALAVRATAHIDVARGREGQAYAPTVLDVIARLRGEGGEWRAAVEYEGRSAPAVDHYAAVIAYRSRRDTLALDLSGRLRNVVADGQPTLAARNATHDGCLTVDLPRVATLGATRESARVRLTACRPSAGELMLDAEVVSDGTAATLRVLGVDAIPNGLYQVQFQFPLAGTFIGRARWRVRSRGGRPQIMSRTGSKRALTIRRLGQALARRYRVLARRVPRMEAGHRVR